MIWRVVSMAVGSSPRVRGEVSAGNTLTKTPGIIPAGAGRRPRWRRAWRPPWDHPRGCGEKRLAPGRRGWSVGIIPAGAGRRRRPRRAGPGCGDHPRGCGEKLSTRWASAFAMGSSPRVRGEASCRNRSALRAGIIPAGAGRRAQSGHRRVGSGDHPRGCGEKSHIQPS